MWHLTCRDPQNSQTPTDRKKDCKARRTAAALKRSEQLHPILESRARLRVTGAQGEMSMS
jgi:hypothetical protein